MFCRSSKKRARKVSEVSNISAVSTPKSPVADVEVTENEAMPAPQVTIGPDGSIILNEQR